MKRFFTLIMLMLALAVAAVANPVDLKTAKQVGFQFLQGSTAIKLPAAEALSLATVYSTAAGVPAFYVFNADAGFVIVSADDCATPILGYSNKGRFNPDELPIQMEAYLQSFVAQIQYGIEHHLQAEAPVAHRWELVCTKGVLTDEKATTVVEPLISAAWGQGCNYNDHCPDDVNGPCQHVLVGCVAVAMGQIMHYWGYPTIGNGSYGYYPDGYPYQGVNFGATTYQWNNMPNSLDGASATQVDAVATLLWHCGVAVDMQYGVNASGAYSNDVPNALTGYFRYANDLQYLCRYDYSTSQWVAKMKESLDLGRPIYYSGVDTDGQGGHAFVCDGYDASNLLHFNWGWYGNQNNYFAVDALDVAIYHFNDWNCAIIHIHPDNETNFAVSASASPANGGAVSGAGYYPSGTTCTLTATSNIGYHFSHWSRNGVQVSTNPTYSFTVTQDVSFVAHFQQSGSFQSSALGYTTYDWQSNDGARTWTIAWPDGKVSFAYTSASDNTFSDRGTAIDTYNPGNGTWSLSGGRVENEKTGFGTIARYGSNGIVVASHTPTDCAIYIVPNKDNVTSNSVSRTLTLDPTNGPCWPNVMTSGPNRTIIHVIATATDNNVSGMGNVTDPMIYFRSSDGGQTWDRQNVVLPYMGSSDAIDWTSNCCYWMETTDDNCLALVVNNAWSDGMVLYSYDDGETWQRKVFFKHPNPSATFDGPMYYPRWTSCKWDSQHHLHVLYEFNATTGAPGSGSFYPSIGGVAYWNETMPYAIGGNAQSAIAGNLVPGQPFVMDSAYLHMDVYNSWWLLPSTTHEMWPEYVGYLPPLTGNGIPEDPYNHTGFNISDRSLHGSYNSGVCAFPVLCMVPGTDEMVAVWSAMDENHTDSNGNYYYKLFARYSSDEGQTWSDMVQLTGYSSQFDNMEFIYNQAAVVGRKLVVASQADGTTGTYVQSDDDDPNDNHYRGFVFDLDDLFDTNTSDGFSISVLANPAQGGTVSGGGTYASGATCTLTAAAHAGYSFSHWSLNGTQVSTNTTYSFTVTGNATYIANFQQDEVFETAPLGYTTYDWQSNDGARTWTIAWPDGKVSFAYTSASDNSFSDRGTAIDTYNPSNGTWSLSGGRVENERTGFGTIARYGSNGIVVASHTSTECAIYIVPDKDNITSNSASRTLTLDPTNDPCWPNVMTSGPNRTIIHVIATASDNHVSGMGSVTNPLIYFRSSDGGLTWDRQNVVLPYMGSSDASNWNSNCCYWMETTDDNCLALVVNNAWSDGMVLYSYDDGETWQRKVFYKHPNPFATFDGPTYYPRWTSCQWDSQHHLHVLYEFNGTTGAPGSGSFYPSIGGVAYWNESMPYASGGSAQSAIAGNLVPGQPFVMDSAYLHMDIYASWWLFSDATHEMWPEYVGYLSPLNGNGVPENPYNNTGFNIADRNLHGSYNSGVCGFPVLCRVPGTDEMVAVWSAMDENHTDSNGNYYYKLFARYSSDGGQTWSDMIQLTGYSSQFDNMEFVYNQAAVVGRKLVVASQADGTTGTYVQSDDSNSYDNHYQGFVFDIDALFATTPVQECSITVEAFPASMGSVQGGGTYPTGASCEIVATPANGCCFDNWTKNGVVVSSNATFSFIVTESAHYVAHFSQATVTYQVTATVNPTQGGSVSGTGPYEAGSLCELVATANPGYQFVKWTRNGAQVSVNSHYSFTVTQDVSLVAHFEQQTVYYTISASADPAEGGDVYGADVYPAGSVCTLTAAPRQGYEFVNWTKNGSVVSTNPSFSFNVTGDASYVAHFERIYTVTVAADPSEGGVVHGGGTYHYGASASVSVDLNPNYEFVQWTLNGTVVSDYPSYTFVVMGDCHLVAHLSFVDDVNDVAASVLSVSPNPAQDKLTVRGEAMHSVRVFNLQGQLVLSEECANADHVELNLSSLSAGIYTVSVRLAEGRVVNRLFVKE